MSKDVSFSSLTLFVSKDSFIVGDLLLIRLVLSKTDSSMHYSEDFCDSLVSLSESTEDKTSRIRNKSPTIKESLDTNNVKLEKLTSFDILAKSDTQNSDTKIDLQ
jgi:hypothetical protein